jgi:hypothetical protein
MTKTIEMVTSMVKKIFSLNKGEETKREGEERSGSG